MKLKKIAALLLTGVLSVSAFSYQGANIYAGQDIPEISEDYSGETVTDADIITPDLSIQPETEDVKITESEQTDTVENGLADIEASDQNNPYDIGDTKADNLTGSEQIIAEETNVADSSESLADGEVTGSGTSADPWGLTLNRTVTADTVEGKNVTHFYTFHIDKKGVVRPHACKSVKNSGSHIDLKIYAGAPNDNRLVYRRENIAFYGQNTTEFTDIGKTGLIPGDYTVEILSKGCPGYKLEIDYEQSDYYEEEIDSPEAPKKIKIGNYTYYGETTNGYEELDPADYYTFTISGKSKISIKGKPDENVYLTIHIYTDPECTDEHKVEDKYNSMYELELTTKNELPAGNYYIKVTNGLPAAEHYGYHFSVSASNAKAIVNEEEWEEEQDPYTVIAPYLGQYDGLDGEWYVSKRLDSGRILYVGMKYTGTVEYDGRKHVVKGTKKASSSINPDIESSGVIVVLGGEKLTGITTSGYKYKNNQNPATTGYYANDGDTDRFVGMTSMQIIPTVKYNTKDDAIKKILKEEKDFKKKLSALLSAKLVKKNTPPANGSAWNWNTYSSEPVLVEIRPLNVGDNPEIHTKTEVKNNPALKQSGGFFVYDGKTSVSFKVIQLNGEKHICPVSGKAGSLSYQVAYQLDNGVVKTKQLKLRAGQWNNVVDTDEDGDYVIVPLTKGTFDYIVSREMCPGYDLHLDIYDGDDVECYTAFNRGYFTGTFDFIERAESVKEKERKQYYPE